MPNKATAMIAKVVATGLRSKFWNQETAGIKALGGMKGYVSKLPLHASGAQCVRKNIGML